MRLVINSTFKPFTYDEMIKPLAQYKEVFDTVQQGYDDLVVQTEAWKDIANQENSPEAYAMYKQYSDRLNALSESFSKEGLKIGTRKSLSKMKRDYAREIVPIANAEAARKESKKYRQEVLSKDSSAIFKSNPTSLDDFLHGKTPDETYVSGNAITARTAAKAEAIGKALFSDPTFKLVLGKQQYQIMQANGATPEQLFKAVSQDPDAIPYLSKIFNDEWKATDAKSFGAIEQESIRNAIVTGMYAALAKPTYNYVANGEYKNAGQRASLALDQQRVGLEAARLSLAQQELADSVYNRAAARGDKPLWTRNGVSYYSDGRTEQRVVHNISLNQNSNRDTWPYRYKVKEGHTYTSPSGEKYNSGEVFNSVYNPLEILTNLAHKDIELVPGTDTYWGPETPIIEFKKADAPGSDSETEEELKTDNNGL